MGDARTNKELLLAFDRIRVLVAKDFKLKYNSTALGFLWSLLVPMFTSGVYFFVFGIMMRFNSKNYLLYLMSGTFLWQFFSNVIVMSGASLMGNAGLLKKTNFNRELIVWGTFFTECAHFFLTIPVLVGIMLFYGVIPDPITILPNLVVVFLAIMLLTVGLGFAYAAINVFFRDLERIMMIFLMAWMFASPVFIPVENVPEKWMWVYKVNPAAVILKIWRDIFYVPTWHPGDWLPLLAVCGFVFFAGRWVFRKMEAGFAEMM